ncbi:hypothetical protein ACFVAF_18045 [Streptomyces sp. NPDC057596]|uniref:hypothetical protein n=1 Tax=Streptomyces sp. NPDC057596 TaxID=3346178 RepID=UPI0036930204
MNTQAVNAAAGVIAAAMEQGKTIPATLAIALDSACMLQSPETAAEFEKLLRWHQEDGAEITKLVARIERLRGRVAELEELLVAKDRPADEDPIAYTLTDKATVLEDAVTPQVRPLWAKVDEDVTPQVRRLRALLAGQREQLLGGGV